MHGFCNTKAPSASLTFTMFVGPLAVAGRVFQNSKVQGARNPYEVVHDRARLFIKNFYPKTGEMGQKMCEKWPKISFFLYLLNNLVFKFY